MLGFGTKFIEINLKGLDDTEKVHRGGYVHVFGVRAHDTASRLVGVALTTKDAAEIMSMAEMVGHMPTLEVPERAWFYVAALGPAHFEKDVEPEGDTPS